jgi:hypothetical protein
MRVRPEHGGSMDLRNVGTLPQHHTASQTWRPRLKTCLFLLLHPTQILDNKILLLFIIFLFIIHYYHYYLEIHDPYHHNYLHPGSSSGRGRYLFLFATASRPALEPNQPPVQCVTGAHSPRIKRPGRQVDHSPPSSAKVKNAWSCASTTCMASWRGI